MLSNESNEAVATDRSCLVNIYAKRSWSISSKQCVCGRKKAMDPICYITLHCTIFNYNPVLSIKSTSCVNIRTPFN